MRKRPATYKIIWRDIHLVMKSGVIYDPKALLSQVEGKIGASP